MAPVNRILPAVNSTRKGNLRLSFHRGAFDNQEAQNRSAYSTAYVISDFLRDTVDSFWRATPIPSLKTSKEILILLERTDDDPRFAELVQEQLCQLNPKVRDQIRIVPSLRNVSDLERDRYLAAKELDWDAGQRQALLDKLNQAGQKLTSFDPVEGFEHVRFAELKADEKLIEAGCAVRLCLYPAGRWAEDYSAWRISILLCHRVAAARHNRCHSRRRPQCGYRCRTGHVLIDDPKGSLPALLVCAIFAVGTEEYSCG